jgi:hypothetical protein
MECGFAFPWYKVANDSILHYMAGNWLDMIQDDSHGFFSTEHGGTHNSH